MSIASVLTDHLAQQRTLSSAIPFRAILRLTESRRNRQIPFWKDVRPYRVLNGSLQGRYRAIRSPTFVHLLRGCTHLHLRQSFQPNSVAGTSSRTQGKAIERMILDVDNACVRRWVAMLEYGNPYGIRRLHVRSSWSAVVFGSDTFS